MGKENKADEPRPRRGRRALTPEEKSKALAYKMLEERAVKDPLLQNAMIAYFCGIDISKIDRHIDRIDMKQELDVEVIKLAIKMIKEDLELQRIIVRAKAFEIMGMKDPELEPKPPPTPRPDPYDVLINNLEKKQKLEDLVKTRQPGFLESVGNTFKDPTVISALLTLLNNIVVMKQQGAPPVPQGGEQEYYLELNHQFYKVSKAELEAYHHLKSILPISASVQPTPAPVDPNTGLPTEPPASDQPDIPGLAKPVEAPENPPDSSP